MTTRSYDDRWREAVATRLADQPNGLGPVLRAADLNHLPGPVRRYVAASGAVDRPIPRNVRIEFDAVMRRRPGEAGMAARSVQLNWFDRPTRLFLMTARMFGLPVRALHCYRDEQATFQVRAAGLLTMVDLSGDPISDGETVTVLNDLCVFAPGTLADARLKWVAIDERTAGVTFRNGHRVARATLAFDDHDQLVDFWSDDRPESVGKTLVARRWRTPISDYREVDGLRLPHRGLAVYERPNGPFTYGEFSLRSIRYDVAMPG